MTLRQFIETSYAIVIEELRDVGMPLHQAARKVDDLLRPVVIALAPDPEAAMWEERRRRAKENEAAYAALGAATGTTIGHKVKGPIPA